MGYGEVRKGFWRDYVQLYYLTPHLKAEAVIWKKTWLYVKGAHLVYMVMDVN